MSVLGQYIYSVIITAIFVSVLLSFVSDKGTAASVIKLTSYLFVALVVISPIIKLRFNNLLDYSDDFELSASTIASEAERETELTISSVIKDKLEAYIFDRASTMGANISSEIFFQNDNSYIPESITITGSVSPYIKNQLTNVIVEELGIPEERQTWNPT